MISFIQYIDIHGCMLRGYGRPTENPWLFTSYFLALGGHNFMREDYLDLLRRYFGWTERYEGLYGRKANNWYPKGHPQYPEYNYISRDEVVGQYCWRFYLNLPDSQRIATNAAISRLYTFDDESGEINLRYYHPMANQAFYELIAYGKSYKNLFLMVSDLFNIVDVFKDEHSSNLKMWLRYTVLEQAGVMSPLLKVSRKILYTIWKWKLGKNWLSEMFKRYFQGDENHPCVILAKVD